jgi:spermidine synthase
MSTATAALPRQPITTSETARAAPLFWIGSLLFFCSGATGLAYEVIWFKRFAHVWGSSALAMACVVASFLAGLGVGAHVLGRVADRVKWPLLWYGVLEIAIGVLAAVVLLEIEWLLPLASSLYPSLHGQPLMYWLVRFALSLLILGPICFMMGGTLPLLVRQFTPLGSPLRQSVGWLYAINTLGAATGCYLAGFHLLPAFGLGLTNTGIVMANVVIGVAAILLVLGQRHGTPHGAPVAATAPVSTPVRTTSTHEGEIWPIYVVAAVAGCASLMLQMIWARQLALILGGSTYVFTAILCIFLLGIGLGSLIFDHWLKHRADARLLPALVILVLVASAAFAKLAIPALSLMVGFFRAERGWNPFNVGLSLGISGVLQFVPTLAMGVLFPLLVHLTRRTAAQAGRAVGTVYALNTAGSIIGAQITSVLLIPRFGTDAMVAAALAAYIVCGVLLVMDSSWREKLVLGVVLLAGGFSVHLATLTPDPRLTNFGFYIYGYTPPRELFSTVEVRYFREGPTCNVVVTDVGPSRALRVNGKVDASNGSDMPMQVGLAYFPRLLHPRARDVLTIGFGSGATCGAALAFPDTNLLCCEIEPRVVDAAPLFAEINHEVYKHPHFRVAFDDGRNYLQGTAQRYDLILSEPSNPWMAGVSNLFTREFYQAASAKLNEGGILAQWVQVYVSTPADYGMILRTLAGVFPETALIRISRDDTILLASHKPLDLSVENIQAAQALVDASPNARADLSNWFRTTDVRSLLLSKLLLDREGLERFAAWAPGQRVNTDYNARLEFDAPRRLYLGPQSELPRALLAMADVRLTQRLCERWHCDARQVLGLRERARAFQEVGLPSSARNVLEFALRVAPGQPELLAEMLTASSDLPDTEFSRLAQHVPDLPVREAANAAAQLARAGRHGRAAEVYRRMTEAHEQSPSIWLALATALQASGDIPKAIEACRRSLALDLANPAAQELLERLMASASRPPPPPPDKAPGPAPPGDRQDRSP